MNATMLDTDKPFRTARSRAWFAALRDRMRREPSDMLAFDDVQASLNSHGQRSLGKQIVLLHQIIGSEGRYQDFDRRFLPRSEHIEHRWLSIKQAMVEGVDLPPVDLYKISDVYFVRDGNHRVSVARHLDRVDIEANVTELLVDVALTPTLSICTLLFAQENSDFLEWTNLHALRPDERIVFSELGGYLDLVQDINRHRAALAQAQQRLIDRDEAVASWYDNLYLPRIQAIRDQHLLKPCPDRTEADLYRWMLNHPTQLAKCDSCPVPPLRKPRLWDTWLGAVAAFVQLALGTTCLPRRSH